MIGVISDTHGLVRPEALNALETIAPVKAVRGNNDCDLWVNHIPHDQVIEYGPRLFYVFHELGHLDLDPAAEEFSAVIYGHSHRPLAENKNNVLYFNPGSASPRRFSLPISIARLHIEKSRLTAEFIDLSVS